MEHPSETGVHVVTPEGHWLLLRWNLADDEVLADGIRKGYIANIQLRLCQYIGQRYTNAVSGHNGVMSMHRVPVGA